MKQMKKTLWFFAALAAFMCLLVFSVGAYNGTQHGDTGIYYEIQNGEAVITDAVKNIVAANIPEFIRGCPVTKIDDNAFEDCTGLKSVTIPNGVTSIGESAFYGCTFLTKINWNAENVADFKFENYIFSNAGTKTEGIDVVFDDNVRSIPGCLFYYPYETETPKIKSVTIGDSVTRIGNYAFYGCSEFKGITIPDGVTNIGDFAFGGCTGLTSVTIPNSVTRIGNEAFYGCTGLISIRISDGVTSIGNDAFGGCTGLTSITIPNSVTDIGSSAFGDCTGLTSITIPNSVTDIGRYAFGGCTKLKSITFPDSITSMGGRCVFKYEVV